MKSILASLLIFILLTSCSSAFVENTTALPNTPTATPKVTQTPTAFLPTETLTPLPPVEATTEAFGTICEWPAKDYHAEISPDGQWIAMSCRGEDGIVDSYLKVVSIQGSKNWSIHYADYAKGMYYDRRNMISPFHWTKDGKYLFVTSEDTGSGCCWIGWDVLFVMLNLENGKQTEIANYIGELPGASFSVSTSDRYVLSLPLVRLNILDLQTGKKREIKLKIENGVAGYPLMSLDDKKVIIVLREYPKDVQGDSTFGSLVVINLVNGVQKKLLSGMDYEDTPLPVSWQDNDNVLLQNNNKFWLLNINSAELTETVKPQTTNTP